MLSLVCSCFRSWTPFSLRDHHRLRLMCKPVKVLAYGDVCGQFEHLCKHITLINKKAGPFDLCVCVGEFFSADDVEANQRLLDGEFVPEVPLYLLGPCSTATQQCYPEEPGELTQNITYLGRKGHLTTASGLSVAYLSGLQAHEPDDSHFNADTIDELLVPVLAGGGFTGVDLLLTSEWPADTPKFATTKPSGSSELPDGSRLISRVASALRPRYHFAALHNTWFERNPYRNHKVLIEPAQHCTRFVALARVKNAEKLKYVYAVNIVPLKHLSRAQLTEQPSDAGEFPYNDALVRLQRDKLEREDKTKKSSTGVAMGQFFFDTSARDDMEEKQQKRRGRKRDWMNDDDDEGETRKKQQPAGPCWFCLSSPEVEKHLVGSRVSYSQVVSIGQCTYLAMPRGPLNSMHVMVLPVGHIQSSVVADEAVRQELRRFKKSLNKLAAKRNRAYVFFERNYRTQHMQLQCVPVPMDRVPPLRTTFQNQAEMKGFELSQIPDDEQIWDLINEGCPFFMVELPGGERLYTRQMKGFPVQFGREVLASASILNVPERADWKECVKDKEEETKMTSKFREVFKPWDFTLDEDDE